VLADVEIEVIIVSVGWQEESDELKKTFKII
jgi:hypothetical protein